MMSKNQRFEHKAKTEWSMHKDDLKRSANVKWKTTREELNCQFLWLRWVHMHVAWPRAEIKFKVETLF